MSKPLSVNLSDIDLTLGSDAGPVEILKKITLEVPQGEILAIVGPSGSGKTSMIMIIAGLEAASAGEISVMGKNLSRMNEDQLARFRRDHLGIVFQSFHLLSSMTALENVAVPMELAYVPDAMARARQALDDVGLGHRMGHYPGQLSGGEQQRVALARAFAPRPSLILADEPTGNLDSETGEHIIALMFRLAKDHNSALMLITHDPAIAARCDRVVTMRDGVLSHMSSAGMSSAGMSSAGMSSAGATQPIHTN